MRATTPPPTGRIRGYSPMRRAGALWVITVGIAGALFLLSWGLANIVDILTKDDGEPAGIGITALWRIMAVSEQDAWIVMGVLVALFMVPITLFLSTVLARNDSTPWIALARDTALDLLFYASMVVPVVALLCLPAVLHSSTAVVGVILVLGIGFLCAVLAELSKSKVGLKRTQRDTSRNLKRLKQVERVLRDRAGPYLETPERRSTARLSAVGRRRLRHMWYLMLGVLIPVPLAWLLTAALAFAQAPSRAIGYALLIELLVIVEVALAGFAARGRRVPWTKRGLPVWALAGFFNLLVLGLALFRAARLHWTGTGWWVGAGLFLIPVAGFVFGFILALDLWVYYSWRSCVRRIAVCRQQIKTGDRILAALP